MIENLTDTSPEIARIQRKLWGQLSMSQRLHQIATLTRSVRSLTRYGMTQRCPGIQPSELNALFAKRVYGQKFQNQVLKSSMSDIEIPTALLPLIRACEKLSVRYRIGGSLASSLFGEPRATNDADVILHLKTSDTEAFVEELQSDYILYADSLRQAIALEKCTNALHIETVFKIDLFPLKARPYDQQAHQRRVVIQIEREGQTYDLSFVTPEDILIAKLEWYRLGNEISEQQWRDILGLLKAETLFLDYDYLNLWTQELKVHDLFERAQQEIQSQEDEAGERNEE